MAFDYALIDANGLAHQMRFALKNTDLEYKEQGTHILYGFLSRILDLGVFFETNKFIFAWDSKLSNRKKLYPEYKANRKKGLTEEEVKDLQEAYRQFGILQKEILPAIGFKANYRIRGYEADDVIAYFADKLPGKVVIVSSDEDMYQLLNTSCTIYSPCKKNFVTYNTFTQEYGITSSEWRQVKKLAGCTSDNIKGVKGVGEKTAIKYIHGKLGKETKAYKSIVKALNDGTVALADQLTSLPMRGFPTLSFVQNDLNIRAFVQVCKIYGFDSFLEDDVSEDSILKRWDRWLAF